MAKKITGIRSSSRSRRARRRRRRRSVRRSARQGVNIMDFCKNFNARTAPQKGLIIPVVITVYADRSLHASSRRRRRRAVLLLKAAGVAEGLGRAEQEEGRQGDEAAGRGDREDEDARPERVGPVRGDSRDRGHRAQHGNRGRLVRLRSSRRPRRESEIRPWPDRSHDEGG